ncbi:MAG: exopolysaccharide Pel transporter PelG [Candidatus Eremiobacterota bacterium]
MAGIGFLLKKLLQEDRYVSDFKANLISLVISSGPWLFAVMSIAGLSVFAGSYSVQPVMVLFRVIIVYVYTFSLIITSMFQLVLTRFISDRLYQREYSALFPNFVGAMFLSGLLCFIASSVFISFSTVNFILKILFVILFCTVSFQWIIMVFLSSLRDYIKVVSIYFLGFILSFLAAMIAGNYWHTEGYLAGFTLGQVAIVIFLIGRIKSEFTWGEDRIFEFTIYFNKYPQLALAAFLYNLGYWLDKLIVWYSPEGIRMEAVFLAHYPYDTSSFLAALTIIPAMSVFFLQVETDFYEGLRKYINTILNEGTYKEIEEKRIMLISALKDKLLHITKIQFFITLIIFLIAPYIIRFLHFNADDVVPVFRILIVAAFFQILFLVLVVLHWYLELLTDSLVCISIFTMLNGILSYLFIWHSSFTLGTGYLIAIIISTVIIFFNLMYKMKHLNYLTFLCKPVSQGQPVMPKFKSVTSDRVPVNRGCNDHDLFDHKDV